MFRIRTLDSLSAIGIEKLDSKNFEVGDTINDPDGILLRSYDMHGMELFSNLKGVARAGAGVNNIPIEACTERGIVVFNTPGANANSVKELVLAGMLLSSRKIVEGIAWARSLAGSGGEVPKLIEKGKKEFVGPEITGKTLGVIGLGAIGVLVANDAVGVGMKVIGHDPFISIESAWGLSRGVKRAAMLEELLTQSDYITLHLPLSEKTEHYLSADQFRHMKRSVRILNFARGGLVSNADLIKAICDGVVERYVTDFPDEELVGNEKVIPIPHLGASTPEAEDNCAVMAVDQLTSFLKTGNIRNSVNFPLCDMAMTGEARIVIANANIPNMVGQITTILAEEKINISDMLNRHLGGYAYNSVDIEGAVSPATISRLRQIEGVAMVRAIHNS